MNFGRIKILGSWIWANTDSITKWMQVAALIVAGYWAYTRFFRVEAPSLEPVAHVGFQVDENGEGDLCRVAINVDISNEGRSSFDVKKLRIRIWRSTAPRPTTGSPAYFDVNRMEQGELVVDANPPSDLELQGGYFPPGSKYHQTFTWDFRKLDGVYLVRADAYDLRGILSSGRVWSQWSCGQ